MCSLLEELSPIKLGQSNTGPTLLWASVSRETTKNTGTLKEKDYSTKDRSKIGSGERANYWLQRHNGKGRGLKFCKLLDVRFTFFRTIRWSEQKVF